MGGCGGRPQTIVTKCSLQNVVYNWTTQWAFASLSLSLAHWRNLPSEGIREVCGMAVEMPVLSFA